MLLQQQLAEELQTFPRWKLRQPAVNTVASKALEVESENLLWGLFLQPAECAL